MDAFFIVVRTLSARIILIGISRLLSMGSLFVPPENNFVSQLDRIVVPPFPCSFPWHSHPDYLHLKEISDAWILFRFSNFRSLSPFSAEALIQARFDLLIALTHSNGIPKRLIPIVKLTSWFFAFDNVIDHPEEMGADPRAANEAGIVKVLDGEEETSAACGAVSRLLNESAHDWWDEFREEMPVTQKLRFIRRFKDYLDATRTQIGFRKAKFLPDLETYIQLRRVSSGWLIYCVLIEYGLGFQLDDETLAHPLMRELQDAATMHCCWVNDLSSFKKEYLEGDYLNLVPVMYADCKTTAPPTLQQSVLNAFRMLKDVDNECVQIVNEVKRSGELMQKPGIESFLDGVGRWLGGNIYWHLVSARYH